MALNLSRNTKVFVSSVNGVTASAASSEGGIAGTKDHGGSASGTYAVGDMAGRGAIDKLVDALGGATGFGKGFAKITNPIFGMKDTIEGKEVQRGPKGHVQDFTLNALPEDTLVMAGGTRLGDGAEKELKQIKQLLGEILNKDNNVYMDGNKVGTQLALSNPKMQ